MVNAVRRLFVVAILLIALPSLGWARGFRVNQIPNGTVNRCANCHVNPAGGGPRDPFGKMVGSRFLDASGNVLWGPELALLDADGDGFPNGLELQDRFGQWRPGDPAPGRTDLVSKPGDPNSLPQLAARLQLQFTGMSPHVGQKLSVRAVDKENGLEAGRAVVQQVPGADFTVSVQGLLIGHSYWVDFFADHNKNGIYDLPPTDHAWRLDLDNVAGDTTLQFAHHTNFVDVNWPYLLTVNFTGMSPHLGQGLWLRVTEAGSGKEVARTRVTAIPSADFSVSVSGLQKGGTYNVDFFADANGNGLYDAPPTDHAWRISGVQSQGDVAVDFAHNTNFTDIGWPYLLTFQLVNMNPHVGEKFEARLLVEATGVELARATIPAVPVANFQVLFPVLTQSGVYQLDFYADHNGNGKYDSPPTDHAWRIVFPYADGDTTVIFFHNTYFADIPWPAGTAVESGKTESRPARFSLAQNYPNPFNPETAIEFALPKTAYTELSVFNLRGELVAKLVGRVLPAGEHRVIWNGLNQAGEPVPSGIYLYRLKAGKFAQTRRMVLLK